MACETSRPHAELSPSRAWWLRVPAVLLSPRSVFFALREDDPDDVAARSEPILLLVWLAGMAAVLATPTAGGLLDNPEYDALLLAVWTFIAGGIYGAVGYFVFGFAAVLRRAAARQPRDFRRERQLVGFALVPLAVSFLLLLPLRLALYGGDTFRGGGADEGAGRPRCSGSSSPSSPGPSRCSLVGVRSSTAGAGFARWRARRGAALLAAIVGVFATI